MAEFITLYLPPLASDSYRQAIDFQKILVRGKFHYYFSPSRGKLYKLSKSEEIKLKLTGQIAESKDATPEFLKKITSKTMIISTSKKMHIFPTTLCNSSCIYCYASPGKCRYKLSLKTAQKAIDFIANKSEPLEINFHGGGEPLLEKGLIAKIIKYAKKKCCKVRVLVQSNGVMDKKTRAWVLKNVDYLVISCDGPPEIQDVQRPLKGKRKSSGYVESTIKFFANKKIGFHVMATITPLSVLKMDKILEYFHSLGVKCVGMNPVFGHNGYDVDLNLFGKKFIEAKKLADTLGVLLFSPQMFPIHRGRTQGCGFSDIMFCLTPDGFVSNCYETVSSKIGPKEFLYGRFDGNGFKFDQKKVSWMRKRRVENLPYCQQCLLRWTCAGGCASHSLKETGDLFAQPKDKCRVKQEIFKDYLIHLAKNFFNKTQKRK